MKKIDFITILLLLALCFLGFFLYKVVFNDEGSYAYVTVNGSEYARLPLSSDCELKIISDKGHNLLIIEDGTAYISEATCSDLICVNHKAILNEGETIICLPNRVVVEIVSE